jgi:hypothetical protein
LLVGLDETPAGSVYFLPSLLWRTRGFFCSFCFAVEWSLVVVRGDAALVVFAVVSGVWGVGATVVSYQRTAFPWWADALVGAAVPG